MQLTKMIVALVAAFASAVVLAGAAETSSVAVTVNPDGSGSASGIMSAARTSSNDFELIGCGIKGFKSGSPDFGFCQAQDADENYVVCFAYKGNLMSTINAIADYSYIRFDFDKNGECTRLDFSTQSQYLPSNVTAN
jgi:hypothetical protein